MRTFAAAAVIVLGGCVAQSMNPSRATPITDAAPGATDAGGLSSLEDAGDHSSSDANSSDSAMPVPLTRDEFLRVTTDFSGGFCEPECPILKRSVEAGGVLVLEDEKGVERFHLSSDEYEAVLAIVLDPAFLQALRDSSDCHGYPDVGTTIQIALKGVGVLMDGMPASCINARTVSDHIYNRLVWLLIDLQKAHLDCSADTPTADRPGRRLCDICNIDDC